MSPAVRQAVSRESGWLAVLGAAPLMLFPSPLRLTAALVLLGGVIAARHLTAREPYWPATPFTWPIGLLALMLVPAVLVSPFPETTLPKISAIILGFAVLRAVVLHADGPARVWVAAGVYVVVGVGLIAPGVLATDWIDKVRPLTAITAFVPRVIRGLPGTGTEGAVNPNALGGTTLMFLPMLAAIGLIAWDPDRALPAFLQGWRARFRVPVTLLAAAIGGVLVLSQSRTSWMALAVTLTVLAALEWRRLRLGALAATVVLTVAVVAAGPATVAQRVWTTGTPTAAGSRFELSLGDRAEIWSRAVSGIRDFPVTGMGLNAFRKLVHPLYPMTTVPAGRDIAHSHNVFLQTALDVGVPGLIAYLAVLMVATALCWQMYMSGTRWVRRLALGLWGNLLGVHLFGLTDAVVLGAKVGIFVWFDIALIAALYMCTIAPAAGERPVTA